MNFINIIETGPEPYATGKNIDEGTYQEPPPDQRRTSALALGGKRQGPGIITIGGLDHCVEWKPQTAADRDLMVLWLLQLQY